MYIIKPNHILAHLQIEQDAYQDDLGFSTGWIGKSSSGKVRGPAASDKTQVSISKRLQVNINTY